MRKCPRCKQVKSLNEFGKNSRSKNGHATYCLICQRAGCRNYYESRPDMLERSKILRRLRKKSIQEVIWNYLTNHPCIDCGENDPIVLDFDHVKGEKKKEISRMIKGNNGIKSILEEIDKCEVRCANCHRKKTAKTMNWYKLVLNKNLGTSASIPKLEAEVPDEV
jgi:hypothetical protein